MTMLGAVLISFGLATSASCQSKPAAAPQPAFEQVARQAARAREADRLPDAVRLYRNAVALRPGWAEGWWYLSTLLYELDRYPEARDSFRRYLRLERRNGPGHALLGLCLFKTAEYEEALEELERGNLLGLGNDQIREVSHYHLALLRIRFGRFEEAQRLLLNYAQEMDQRPRMMEALGMAALRLPMFPGELPPDQRDLVMMTATAVRSTNTIKEPRPEQAFKALIARYPNAPNVHYLYGSYALVNNLEEGVKQLEREIEISPDHVPALAQLALALLQQGEFEKALPHARKAAALAPRDFAARHTFGRVLVQCGQLEEGIRELEAARGMAPNSPFVHFALAGAYRNAGRLEDAEKEMAEFERLKKLLDAEKGVK